VHRTLEDGTIAVVLVNGAGCGKASSSLSYYVAMNLLGLLVMQRHLEPATSAAERDYRRELPSECVRVLTVFTGLIDPEQRRLRYASAGHETALVLSDDRSHRHLGVTGPAFGLLGTPCYHAVSTEFATGDTLIVVTDGVTMARDNRGVPFGTSGVIRLAMRTGSTGEQLAQELIDEASEYAGEFTDDRAALTVKAAW
jgi:serine phosphatase RsbU (regulator of sigma subunit)